MEVSPFYLFFIPFLVLTPKVRCCSCKVVAAYMESSNQEVKGLAAAEVQPLIDSGLLKILDKKPEGQG